MRDYEALSRAHFNRRAAAYDATDTAFYSKYGKISCADAASYLKAMDYEALLDVGCGTGYLLQLLAKQRPARYAGIDLAEEMVKVAQGKGIPGAQIRQGSAERLPYPDSSFDVVACIQSFHHYPHPERAMAEARRVLRPGGLYLLSDTGMGGLGGWIYNHVLFPLMKSGDCHTDNRQGIARMMERCGFRAVQQRQLQGCIYTVVGQK